MKLIWSDYEPTPGNHVYLLTRRVWLCTIGTRIRPWHDISWTKGALFTRWFILGLGRKW